MTSILIVEDNESKRLSIEEVVRKTFDACHIDAALSVRSAIEKLDAFQFDAVIVDMSLPTFDISVRESGGTPRPLGGLELFAHLDSAGSALPLIVVSAYGTLGEGNAAVSLEDLARRLAREYPELYRGYVFFDSIYTVWSVELTGLLRRVIA